MLLMESCRLHHRTTATVLQVDGVVAYMRLVEMHDHIMMHTV